MSTIYIARQPIYNPDLRVIGFELLYRDSQVNKTEIDDNFSASTETIVNSFINIGIDNLVGTSKAFVNLPKEFILNNDLLPMFHNQSVFEVLEHVQPDAEIIEGLKRLKAAGYMLAFNETIYSNKVNSLLELADYVKIDVQSYNLDVLKQRVAILKNNYDFKLIAEKVETQELYEICKSLKFDFYQGYFFCHPQMVIQKNIPANKMVVLNLIGQLQKPDISFSEIESILAQDVTLVYKLLRYINSAEFSLRREIDSIKDAVVLLGLDNIKNWASLILLGNLNTNKPEQLMVTALVRAKMSELLSHEINPELENQAFICGLFSVLDALMDTPIIDLLDNVTLQTDIKLALLDFDGELGMILKNCILFEQGNFNKLEEEIITSESYSQSYISAIKWADKTMSELNNNV